MSSNLPQIDNVSLDYAAERLVYALEGLRREEALREGLQETPHRFAKAWRHWAGGYTEDPAEVLKVFEDGAEGCDQMVMVKDIPIYSKCVVGSTFVETPRGRVPIKRLKDGDLIYTMDPATFELSIVACQNPRITQRDAELVQIHTDNDSLICTPDHKILKTDGTWVEAQHLKSNDRLASLYRGVQNGRDAGTGESTAQYTKAYPVLMSSRYTRPSENITGITITASGWRITRSARPQRQRPAGAKKSERNDRPASKPHGNDARPTRRQWPSIAVSAQKRRLPGTMSSTE